MWPAWVEPAAWTFLVILAAEVVVLGVRAWRGTRQMRELVLYTIQVRQAVADVKAAVESGAADLLVGVNDLPEISKTLHSIDFRGSEVTGR